MRQLLERLVALRTTSPRFLEAYVLEAEVAHDRHETVSLEKVEGKLVLRDSPTDPIADFPVVKFEGIVWRVFTTRHTVTLGEDVDPEAFAPFAHARYDVF